MGAGLLKSHLVFKLSDSLFLCICFWLVYKEQFKGCTFQTARQSSIAIALCSCLSWVTFRQHQKPKKELSGRPLCTMSLRICIISSWTLKPITLSVMDSQTIFGSPLHFFHPSSLCIILVLSHFPLYLIKIHPQEDCLCALWGQVYVIYKIQYPICNENKWI